MQLVRIRQSPETEQLGLAGKIGEVYGFTTPSHSGVTVVGELQADFAVSVFFEETRQQHWFAEDLLEMLDHDPGLVANIGGKKMFYRYGRWQQIEPGT